MSRLYAEIEKNRLEVRDGLALFAAGEIHLGEERIVGAQDRLRALAEECRRAAGCDVVRVFDTFDGLLRRQLATLKAQAAGLVALKSRGGENQQGAEPASQDNSPLSEVTRSEALLHGTDLRKLITLNEPVKAALDDWLTWMRPLLMDGYENYQFLRQETAPVFEQGGLPEALLFAIVTVETGGRVHAQSRAGAAGLLQFMPETGRAYGLTEVDGFDMRFDPAAATRASVAFLNDQLKVLNDSLEKVLAAYNGGQSRVRGLDRRLGGADFWDRRFYAALPRETRDYVPRILAAAWLFLHPQDYNLEFPHFPTRRTELVVKEEIAMNELALCLGQAENQPNGWFRTLRNLNPRLEPGERVAAGESLVLPSFLVAAYEERCLGEEKMGWVKELHDANYPPEPKSTPYTVRRGDTLGKLAARFACASLKEIANLNNLRSPYLIQVGQRLKIPSCS